MKGVVGIIFCCFTLMPSANAAEASTPDEVVWHWFSHCDDGRTITVEVNQGKKTIFESSFPICKMHRSDISPEPVQKTLDFSFKNEKRSYFGETKGDQLEGSIWEAGSDPNDVVLGLSFVAKNQIWLNTIVIVEPDKPSQVSLGQGLVVKIHSGSQLPSNCSSTKLTDDDSRILLYVLPVSITNRKEGVDVTIEEEKGWEKEYPAADFFTAVVMGEKPSHQSFSGMLGHYAVERRSGTVISLGDFSEVIGGELGRIQKLMRKEHCIQVGK